MKPSYVLLAVASLLVGALGILLTRTMAQSTTPTPDPVNTMNSPIERDLLKFPSRGTAPELTNTIWLNTNVPLRLENLHGQVVLLEFWTFDCINCIRTIPYVEQWHQTYQDQGLIVIGNHFPEFSYEHDVQNVRDALSRLNITYPVAIDNDGEIWEAYNQRYWPTIYLIDKWGEIRYVHFGEGRYTETEKTIQHLLAEKYSTELVGAEAGSTDIALEYLTTDIDLNVRSGAGLDFDIIGSIHANMALVVLSEENGWYKINYNDGEGYVSADYVTVATEG